MPGANNASKPLILLPELSKASNIHLTETERESIQNVHKGYQKIILEKEFGGGFSGTRVFLVLPVRFNGVADARVVTKTGPAEALRREKENYDHYAGRALPFNAAQVRECYEQGDQAALNYVFAGGAALGKTMSLEDYYHAQTAEMVNKTLDILLDKVLGEAWYGQTQPFNGLFREEYGRHLPSHEKLEEIVKAIYPRLSLVDGKYIQIQGVNETYLDPLKIYSILLERSLKSRRSFVHGDLHVRNVLVDESGGGWLIDFAKVRERHNLFDFIKLETYIRLIALAQVSGAFSLNEYAQFERALNATTLGQDSTPPANIELKKAYQVIQTIRRIARKYMGHKPDFKNEYFPALFLYGLSMLKYFPVNGPIPTQLMYMTSCALAVDIFDERKVVKPISEDQSLLKEEQSPTQSAKAARSSDIFDGNAENNTMITGNNNKVNQTSRTVNTEGGAYVGGNVHVQNGDFVGHDKITRNTSASADEIARAFAIIMAEVNREKDGAKKERAEKLVQKLEAEARKGEQADEDNVEGWFTVLANTSADAWEVAVTTLSNPIAGLGTAFKKIIQRAKEEKAKKGGN